MQDFKIAAAQVPSMRGNFDCNVATHCATMQAAALHRVSFLVFPELSLTGYEPDIAAEFAIDPHDLRLDPLRSLARTLGMDVSIGTPLRESSGKPALASLLFTSDGSTDIYRKMHLGSSERACFSAGDAPLVHTVHGRRVGMAICADASQASHPQAYADAGAGIYAAGVFLNDEWYRSDVPRLAGYARQHGMLVVMANHGASDGRYASVGKSAIWLPGGALLAQAAGTGSALVVAAAKGGSWEGDVVLI